MQPAPPSAGANTRLVEMHDRRAGDLLVHPIQECAQVLGAILDKRHERPG
jgi:hypothetical protein